MPSTILHSICVSSLILAESLYDIVIIPTLEIENWGLGRLIYINPGLSDPQTHHYPVMTVVRILRSSKCHCKAKGTLDKAVWGSAFATVSTLSGSPFLRLQLSFVEEHGAIWVDSVLTVFVSLCRRICVDKWRTYCHLGPEFRRNQPSVHLHVRGRCFISSVKCQIVQEW